MNNPNKLAPNLNARLACACDCAYGISKTDGSYTPPDVYHDGAGWIGTPTAIAAPEALTPQGPKINACLIGINPDGIIVSFRGTLPPKWTVASVEDWWQDIVGSEPQAHDPLPGKVHSGFWNALETIWDKVAGEIQTLKTINPGLPIYITGHSKGGPLASLCAARLYLDNTISIVTDNVTTFASPHPGDADFVSGFPDNIKVTRFENYLDIVPLLPPTNTFFKIVHDVLPETLRREFCKYFPHLCKAMENATVWNYTPLGELNYVNRHGGVVEGSNPEANVDYRLAQIFFKLIGLSAAKAALEHLFHHTSAKISHSGFARIGAAHCIACKSDTAERFCAGGYMTGVGGNPICPD